jgi:hypothetical protein
MGTSVARAALQVAKSPVLNSWKEISVYWLGACAPSIAGTPSYSGCTFPGLRLQVRVGSVDATKRVRDRTDYPHTIASDCCHVPLGGRESDDFCRKNVAAHRQTTRSTQSPCRPSETPGPAAKEQAKQSWLMCHRRTRRENSRTSHSTS